MARYWIVGGEYRSTDFAEMAEGHEEKHIGPFETYGAARKEWARLSWSGVDNAHLRYFIRKDDGEGSPARSARAWARLRLLESAARALGFEIKYDPSAPLILSPDRS